MCGPGHCSARAEYSQSVFLISILQFPGVAASIFLPDMHCSSCFAQDNKACSSIHYPKRLIPAERILLNFLGGVSQAGFIVCSAFLTLSKSGEPMSHLGLQLAL